MFKRMIDKRDGKRMLHRYKILLREDLKRREQRVIVHKFLEEKSQQRTKKQGAKAATLALSLKSSINSSQVLSLDSYSTEASAFSLDGGSNQTIDGGWQEEVQWSTSPHNDGPVQYWSEEYQRAYLYDPVTGISTWL
ncbi:hypothetical protein PF001_g27241 [Phytophthora fragariae]|nr:hypothetical protein PF001_g27241 [Phytophthora fragariae]KAE9283838.1 hypothetical protein PF008_g27306 [Phytophthora fragariae]